MSALPDRLPSAMRTLRPPAKALLMVGVLFSQEGYWIEAQSRLEEHFGEIVMETPAMEWDFSDYYKKEIGAPLYRKFVFFRNLIEKDSLSAIKLATYELEKELASGEKRNINLDPGYITPAKLVLASSKNYSHRLYLKDGVFAEVTLMYVHGKFIPHVNTYKDYSDDKYLKFFYLARTLLLFLSGK